LAFSSLTTSAVLKDRTLREYCRAAALRPAAAFGARFLNQDQRSKKGAV
jgi:hypothetical protein